MRLLFEIRFRQIAREPWFESDPMNEHGNDFNVILISEKRLRWRFETECLKPQWVMARPRDLSDKGNCNFADFLNETLACADAFREEEMSPCASLLALSVSRKSVQKRVCKNYQFVACDGEKEKRVVARVTASREFRAREINVNGKWIHHSFMK